MRKIYVSAIIFFFISLQTDAKSDVINDRDFSAFSIGVSIGKMVLSEDIVEYNSKKNNGEKVDEYRGGTAIFSYDIFPMEYLNLNFFSEGSIWYYEFEDTRNNVNFPGMNKLTIGFTPGIAKWNSGKTGGWTLNAGPVYNWIYFDGFRGRGLGYRMSIDIILGTDKNEWMKFLMLFDYSYAVKKGLKIGGTSIMLGCEYMFR